MPQYAFACEACGPFEAWRPAADAGEPLRCPECDAPAARLFTAPGLRRLPTAMRAARDREEKSASAPDVVTTKTGRPMPGHAHAHAHGHAH
jgi:putative FmdB family regulatory protein